MGLTVALGNALSGLRATETSLDAVSRNVANAGVEGYARRRVSAVESLPHGVRMSDVQRMLDTVLQRQMRNEAGAEAKANVRATYLGRLDAAFGEPGGAASLDTLLNGFTAALQTLAGEPGNRVMRDTVVQNGKALAAGLNEASTSVQGLRADTEIQISEDVDEANATLSGIAAVERDLSLVAGGNARADLLDQRDRLVDRLSQLLDIKVTPRGDQGISIFTAGGVALFNGAASQLRFDPKGAIGPDALYNRDPAQSGVGQLLVLDPNNGVVDITSGALRGGEIAGLLSLRDADLPALQGSLDSIAAGLAEALQENPAAPPVFVDRGNGVGVLPYAGGAQFTGFSARITLNPVLAADSSQLIGGEGSKRPQQMLTAIQETRRSFSHDPAQGAGATFSGPLDAFLRRVLDGQASNAVSAKTSAEGQKVVLNSLQARFSETSGVSVDEELARLTELQNAYAANARIVSAVNSMFEALMNI